MFSYDGPTLYCLVSLTTFLAVESGALLSKLHSATNLFASSHLHSLTCHNKCQDTATFCDASHTAAAICLLLKDRQLSILDRNNIQSYLHHARSHLKPRIQLYLSGITKSQGTPSLRTSYHISVAQSTWWYTSTACAPRNTLYGRALTLHTKDYENSSGPAPSSILLLILSMWTGKGFWWVVQQYENAICQNEVDHGEQDTVIQLLVWCIAQSAVSTPFSRL
jgi:hypothetical protein